MWTQISNIISRLGIFQDAIKKCLYKEKTEEEGGGGGNDDKIKDKQNMPFLFSFEQCGFLQAWAEVPT